MKDGKMLRNKSGKVAITIALTGILALAGLLFILYVWTNMPESGIEKPVEIGTPLLYLGILIVAVFIIIMIIKAAS